MKIIKIFYFSIFTDSCVKIFCVLNNIVIIAEKNIISISTLRFNHYTLFVSTQVAYSQNKNFKKIRQFLNLEFSKIPLTLSDPGYLKKLTIRGALWRFCTLKCSNSIFFNIKILYKLN